jgi:1,2-phenylacetyl-CoA epoxidase catalytic subunit
LEGLRAYLGGSASASKSRIFEDLQPDSEILKIIGKTLRKAEHIEIATCIEQRRKDDVKHVYVDTHAATSFSASETTIPIDKYHKDMNKFSYAGDEGYQAVLSFLLEALTRAAVSGGDQC